MIGTINPVRIFEPLPWQEGAWWDKSPVVLLTGSAGGGKSQLALEKANGYAEKYPGAFVLLLRKVKASMTSGTVLFFAESVVNPDRVTHLSSKSRFEYDNGSVVAYMGLEDGKQLQRLRSIGTRGGVDLAVMEEATEFTEADYNAVLARMRGAAAGWRQIILATNPDAHTHWIFARLIQGEEASVYYSGAADNPHNPADYIQTLGRLTGVDRARLVEGRWVQATGLIYDTWSDAENVTPDADYIPGGGDVYWAIDDGYTGQIDGNTGLFTADSHPRVFLLCQLRNDGRLVVFDEALSVKMQPDEHIQDVIDLGYPEPVYAAVDKSAAQLRGLLQDTYGIYTRRSPADVMESVKEARLWISPDENDYRRILVHPRCKHLRAEMVSYRYDDRTGKPVKQFDHTLDALRYLIWTLRRE